MNSIEKSLFKYASVADTWLNKEYNRLRDTINFFKKFTNRDFLEKAEWEDFKEMGTHINSFRSNPLAGGRALGKILNHSLEHYREQFVNLFYGQDDLSFRLDSFIANIRFFNIGSTSEIISYAFPDKYVPMNTVDRNAVDILGVQTGIKKGDSQGVQFVKFNEAIKPIAEKYVEIVGQRTDLPLPIEMDKFFWFVASEEGNSNEEGAETEEDNIIEMPPGEPRYWLLSPGENAYRWDDFYNNGYAAIGWDEMGDLSSLTKIQIQELLQQLFGTTSSKKNDTLALYQFGHVMRKGDIIIAKRGTTEYVGYGIVTSDYYYKPDVPDYRHRHNVKWVAKGSWPDKDIVTKTLTDITKYPDYVSRLRKLLKIDISGGLNNEVQYWWLNANPKYWNILDRKIGETQAYTSHNDANNKRRIYEYFKQVKPGDLVVGYQTSPVRRILAIFEVVKGLHLNSEKREVFEFVIKKFLEEPISWDQVTSLPELKNSEVVNNNQGSLFRLSPIEFDAIQNLISETTGTYNASPKTKYTYETALGESSLAAETFDRFIQILERKKQVILQGPPGTGKSFLANILLKYLTEDQRELYEKVQFHPSYAYEDFVQGLRPKLEGTGIDRLDGIFKILCDRATRALNNNTGQKFVIMIDEINRGNLSKIFGELLYLLEYRSEKIKLTYSPELDFSIPENLYLIGTMNTADRSLALVDYALRRRFAFIDLAPDYDILRNKMMVDKGIDKDKLIQNLKSVNETIYNNLSLGPGFQIGHSYFLRRQNGKIEMITMDLLHIIWAYELEPLLLEYYFDSPKEVENLKKAFFNGML